MLDIIFNLSLLISALCGVFALGAAVDSALTRIMHHRDARDE